MLCSRARSHTSSHRVANDTGSGSAALTTHSRSGNGSSPSWAPWAANASIWRGTSWVWVTRCSRSNARSASGSRAVWLSTMDTEAPMHSGHSTSKTASVKPMGTLCATR